MTSLDWVTSKQFVVSSDLRNEPVVHSVSYYHTQWVVGRISVAAFFSEDSVVCVRARFLAPMFCSQLIVGLPCDVHTVPDLSLITLCLQKVCHLMFVDIFGKCWTDFHNSFTNWFIRKFSMYTQQRFPPHMQYVSTLPCESRKSKNITEFSRWTWQLVMQCKCKCQFI